MRLIGLHILAIFIALTSVVSEGPTLDFYHEQIAQIQSNDSWEVNSLSYNAQKHTGEKSVIAQDFVPIVLISDHSQPLPIFDHYLPIYVQYQIKEYFLLI